MAGWVAFDGDLRVHAAVLRAMTATLALRGPDGEGVWLSEHAALGHRRLAVLDPGHGAQPMLAMRAGQVRAALAYGGETYNFRTLGLDARTGTDTEAVLRSYLRWGEGFVTRLEGMYAFALWDAARETMLLVRDRMGVKPLYYLPLPDGVLFASEPKAIAAHPRARLRVDLDGLRELLSSVRTPGRTAYRDLREVRPGELIRVDRAGLHAVRYWSPPNAEHRDDHRTTVHNVRSLLAAAVTTQSRADVPVCALLSGGLDSTAVAALAPRPLRTVTLAEPVDATPARAAAQLLATDHEEVTITPADLADPINRATALQALEFPTGLGAFHTSLYLLMRAVREHSTVTLTGEAADELFGGYPWWDAPGGAFPWLTPPHGVQADPEGPPTDVLDPVLSKALDLEAYRDNAYREALSEVERTGDGPADRVRERRHLHLTRLLPILLDRMDRMSMACGVEARVPFCDHHLVEYVTNIPWPAESKRLLREAVATDIPPVVLNRVKSPYPAPTGPEYELALRSQLLHVLEDSASPALPLLDRQRAWHLVVAPIAPPPYAAARRAVELILGLDHWLRRLPITLDLP
ncbi:asparagine synthase (glutamine-hydrolyzing) [Dactylosporangium sp. NPDC051541]|uniref:asparagine synthase (glutamine-hydrolyzing) n=1 Tax=Dactylosporangium sp. NPDC051541 TaxID=3363977 RepID=UPI0037B9FB2C